jgi:ATP-binding protein involved in chromosome partitioning
MGIPFLGAVPLDLPIRSQSDAGSPIVVAQPDAPSSVVLRGISEQLAAQVSIRNYSAPVLEID